jgi:hypothetical protein
MTAREAVVTGLITLAAVIGAMAAPLMLDASTKVVIATGMTSFSTTLAGLLGALTLDPRSSFGRSGGN